jgi:uncharacterized protein YbjT (DUF2867 family)
MDSRSRESVVNRILVIGGTGNIGRQVITQLTATRAEVRALVRNPDAARLPQQEPPPKP